MFDGRRILGQGLSRINRLAGMDEGGTCNECSDFNNIKQIFPSAVALEAGGRTF